MHRVGRLGRPWAARGAGVEHGQRVRHPDGRQRCGDRRQVDSRTADTGSSPDPASRAASAAPPASRGAVSITTRDAPASAAASTTRASLGGCAAITTGGTPSRSRPHTVADPCGSRSITAACPPASSWAAERNPEADRIPVLTPADLVRLCFDGSAKARSGGGCNWPGRRVGGSRTARNR